MEAAAHSSTLNVWSSATQSTGRQGMTVTCLWSINVTKMAPGSPPNTYPAVYVSTGAPRKIINPHSVEICLYKLWKFSIWNHHTFEYLCYRSSAANTNILILSVRGRLYTSECDVWRRHILTYEDGPRTERVSRHSMLSQCWTSVSDSCSPLTFVLLGLSYIRFNHLLTRSVKLIKCCGRWPFALIIHFGGYFFSYIYLFFVIKWMENWSKLFSSTWTRNYNFNKTLIICYATVTLLYCRTYNNN